MRYFRIIRELEIGTLSIRLCFERSEEVPCDHMTAHADTVAEAVKNMVDEDDEPSITAARVCDTFRHVRSVRVLDDNGEGGIAFS